MGNKWSEWSLTALRIVAGFLFFCHGAQKILGWFPVPGKVMSFAFPELPWFAGWLELVGGPLIMLGILTRPVAFLLSGEMAVAYFKSHQPKGAFPIENHGELAALFCFLFLFLAAHGGGPYSFDGATRRRRRQ